MRALWILTLCTAAAGAQTWQDAVGYNDWRNQTTEQSPGAGRNVRAGQIETFSGGSGYYLPLKSPGTSAFQGSGIFSNVTLEPKSGAGEQSDHAYTVASFFYGVDGAAPGVLQTSHWSAPNFLSTVVRSNGAAVNVAALDTPVHSHAWIGSAPTEERLARFDYLNDVTKSIGIVGVNNGVSNTVPSVWGSCYNTLCVGITNGDHSRGGTPSGYDAATAGRMKPEVVAPFDVTSWSVGAIAGLTTTLYDRAIQSDQPVEASRPETIKALLLSGATKEEFPAWSRTADKPIDPVFGAGEVNLLQSWRILEAGRTTMAAAAPTGWQWLDFTQAGQKTITITLPPAAANGDFILTAVWNRKVTQTKSTSNVYTYAYNPLANVDLSLTDASGNVLQESKSTIDNVEHLYLRGIAPDQTVTLTISSDRATSVALAWRSVFHMQPKMLPDAEVPYKLLISRLIPGAAFSIERSTDSVIWKELIKLTASDTRMTWTDPEPPASAAFYRLRWRGL